MQSNIINKTVVSASIFLMLGATSCIDKGDLFNNKYNNALKVEIPDGFNWNMTKNAEAVIEPLDEYNGKFMFNIRVYAQDPESGSDVKPVAVGLANQNEPFMKSIVIPSSTKTLYITQTLTDPSGEELNIASASVDVNNIGNVKLTNNRSRSLIFDIYAQILPYLCNGLTGYTSYESCGEDIEDSFFHANTNYRITRDCTIHYTGSILNCGNLYIAPGVKVKFIPLNHNNALIVGAHTKLYNDGCITVSGLSNPTIEIREDAEFHNNGSVDCSLIDFKGHSGVVHLYKYSSIKCNKINIAAGKITMDTGSYINTNVLSTEQGGQEGDVLIMSMNKEEPGNVKGYDYAALLVINNTVEIHKDIKLKGYSDNVKLLIQCPSSQASKLSADSKTTSIVEDATGKIFIPGNSCHEGFGEREPETLSTVTYCMEDQYPEKGDFDLNDIVVELTPILHLNSNTGNTTVDISCKICAVGASKVIAGYVKIGDQEIKLFENAHKEMGTNNGVFINTVKDSQKIEPVTIVKEGIPCNSNFNLNDMKLFIRAGGIDIYAADQGGIDTKTQTIGGVRVPMKDFKYPYEKTSITDAYTEKGYKISDWIESNTQECEDWYKHPTSGKCY